MRFSRPDAGTDEPASDPLSREPESARISLHLRSEASIVVWGTPLSKSYRSLVRELEVISRHALMIDHRHHAFTAVGLDDAFACAEMIEVATLLGARKVAVAWFLSHGATGLLPPGVLADELGLDSMRFEQHYYDGDARDAVEADLSQARELGLGSDTSVTIRGLPYRRKLVAEDLIAACLEEATSR
ncbi:MAG: hypothetical protein HOW73_13010 [Polyangiaceae bacterium]|nr:hypothetical protein [Polyangiaceae bacterium]